MKDYVKGGNSKKAWEAEEHFKSKKDKKREKKLKHLNGISKKKNLYEQYIELETKGNVNNSLLKTGAEALTGGAIAPYLSATLGTKAPILGLALIFAGNYFDDKTSLLKTLGSGVLAHSVAKVKEYSTQTDKGFKDRISGVTDDLLHVMLIRRYDKPSSVDGITKQEPQTRFTIEKLDSATFQNEEIPPSHLSTNTNQIDDNNYLFGLMDDDLGMLFPSDFNE